MPRVAIVACAFVAGALAGKAGKATEPGESRGPTVAKAGGLVAGTVGRVRRSLSFTTRRASASSQRAPATTSSGAGAKVPLGLDAPWGELYRFSESGDMESKDFAPPTAVRRASSFGRIGSYTLSSSTSRRRSSAAPASPAAPATPALSASPITVSHVVTSTLNLKTGCPASSVLMRRPVRASV